MREPRHVPMARPGATPGVRARATSLTSLLSPVRMVISMVISAIRGVLEGALPLVILFCTLALFWEIMTIVRLVLRPNGFAITSEVEAIVAEAGLIIAMLLYLISGLRTLRNVRDRQIEGDIVESWVSLVVLTISLLVAFAPVWSTLTMLQHPAP